MANDEQSIELPQMALTDMNTPPAEDSPKNIVNILNDYCLQLVLLNLKKVDDFWSAARVCTRFQANAKACFPFEDVKFVYKKAHSAEDVISFDSAEDFLNLFGPRIASINCKLESDSKDIGQMNHEENLSSIAQYCGQTLSKLEIVDEERNGSVLHLRSPFQALKHLKLLGVSFYRFDPSSIFPELSRFKISDINGPVEWIANRFSMLQHVEIFFVHKLSDEIFTDFQKHNSQLQILTCTSCNGVTPSVYQNIGDRLPNIIKLGIDKIGMNVTHLSALQHLRKLYLSNSVGTIPNESQTFFRSLVEKNQPIEELSVIGVDNELARILQKLKTIKMLTILTSEEIVLDLVKHLPAIESLSFWTMDGIRLSTVKKFLQNCAKVTEINLCGYLKMDETIDLNGPIKEYESIVALATGRVKVSFIFGKIGGITDYTSRQLLLDTFSSYNNEWIKIFVT